MTVTKIFPDYDLIEFEDCIEINALIRKKGEDNLYHLGQIRMQDTNKSDKGKLDLIKQFIYECYRFIIASNVDKQYPVKDENFPHIVNEYRFWCPIDENQQSEIIRLKEL